MSKKLEMILSWAETFDAASRGIKRSIIAMTIDRIVVHTGYRLDIHFRMTVQQYLGETSMNARSRPSVGAYRTEGRFLRL